MNLNSRKADSQEFVETFKKHRNEMSKYLSIPLHREWDHDIYTNNMQLELIMGLFFEHNEYLWRPTMPKQFEHFFGPAIKGIHKTSVELCELVC